MELAASGFRSKLRPCRRNAHLGQNPLPKQQGRALRRLPWKDRADFAAGTSIRTSHWALLVVLLSKLRLCSRNCSWWFPQGSTGKLRKLLNSIDAQMRSEERRVGKEGRSRWAPYH